MKVQLAWLEQFVLDRDQEASGSSTSSGEDDDLRREGRRFGLSVCLCHNDLLSGNILRGKVGEGKEGEEGGDDAAVAVHLIDYEYAAYNYRAFDLANHFSGE